GGSVAAFEWRAKSERAAGQAESPERGQRDAGGSIRVTRHKFQGNPLGLAQKLGVTLGTGLQSHNVGTGQERLLHALGMNGRGLSAAIPTSLAGLAGMAPALRLASGPTAPEPAAEKSVASDRHPAPRARRSARRANTARKPAPPAG